MSFFRLIQSLLATIGAVGIAFGVAFFVQRVVSEEFFTRPVANDRDVGALLTQDVTLPNEELPPISTKVAEEEKKASLTPEKQTKQISEATEPTQQVKTGPEAWEVSRVKNPYGIPPRSIADINTDTRAALVNIFCNANGALSPITASGVIVSGNGVILTNAHVAQYLLLEETGKVNLRCVVRAGAPAESHYIARVLFVPPPWVRDHAQEITQSKTLGTGEHDWALLYITKTTDGSALPAQFPYVPPDVRSAIGFIGDTILAASYPAGFLGGSSASSSLYPASAPATIQELMTFSSGSADIFSIGGTVTAQSGSSGGAIVNMWGYIVGLIVTMKEGQTTAERDLRALTLNYINADLKAHTGKDFSTFISGNLSERAAFFMDEDGSALAKLLLDSIK